MIPTADACVSKQLQSRCVIERNIFTFVCLTAGPDDAWIGEFYLNHGIVRNTIEAFASGSEKE